jgi:UDP-N-acetylglucosamine--N-acetylmuramyl-(pentapeptide) pyrophosphoryl-undecaprenol N-acetylglucosamine transferase
MIILLVGGGSGGHVSPLLAVADELKQIDPKNRLVYVGEKNGKFFRLAQEHKNIDYTHSVRAGKFRRYHGESFFSKLLDFKTIFLNIRDVFYTFIGVFQSLLMIGKYKPDVAFIKGGFVAVPVGLACRMRRVKFVTHDSDTVPGLANRIVGRWAKMHAVGMPEKFYNYPKNKVIYTGIPVSNLYKPIDRKLKEQYRAQLNIPRKAKVVCVTGGSLGAVRLNNLCANVLERMLLADEHLYVIHQTGDSAQDLYQGLDAEHRKRLFLESFIDDLHVYTGSADIVITRAGATTIASLALQQLPLIIVPNPQLTGGHQTKNAAHLEHSRSAVILSEESLRVNPNHLLSSIEKILDDKNLRKDLKQNLSLLAKSDASRSLAQLIYQVAGEDNN